MSEEEGLICAYDVESGGQGRPIGWQDLARPVSRGYRWIHLDLEAEPARSWLRNESGLGALETSALLADDTRPRATPMGEGLLLILRGVNLNPGADPEDMVSIRMWADATRIISVRRRRLLAVMDLRERIGAGYGPESVGDFISELAMRLVERMANALGTLDERLDELGDEAASVPASRRRPVLLDVRREAIILRRHLSPQRDALARLTTERIAWLGERERMHLREGLDRTTRYIEDLESTRERAAVLQEELSTRISEQLNQRMYALSIVAGIFLPLSFATGLLGINVGGIPGAQTPWAFAAVCAVLVAFGVFEVWLFRKLRWL